MAFISRKSFDDGNRMNRPDIKLTPAQAWEKIKLYCAYQDRCHSEVKEKLYGFGLHRSDVEQQISRLIEENYLNEERFAVSYASGHSRIKKWGKIKITQGLKQKGVSAYCIKKALQLIDEDEYQLGLNKLAEQKWHLLRKEPVMKRRFKCRQFLLQRGFESTIIMETLKRIEQA
ncbi:MAG: regulatory protein RecX [Bacteroidota bacterium]